MERDAFTDERDRVLTRKEVDKKWAWVLTGSGHFFNETIDLINKLNFVDLFVSKAAEEVLVMYKKKGKISREIKIYQDNSSSSAQRSAISLRIRFAAESMSRPANLALI